MKKNNRNENTPPSLSQFHALIREYAIENGMAIPKTDEEFAFLEQHLYSSKLPKHDFSEVLAIITGESENPKVIEFPKPDECFVKELGVAARNGKEIPPEIKERMNTDRDAAQNKH